MKEEQREAMIRIHAFENVSFNPEKRIEQFIKDYSTYENRIIELCDEYGEDRIRATETLFNKAIDYLHAQSRCLSWAITGPAKFPVARNEKRLNICENKLNAFIEFADYLESVFKKKAKRAETPETQKEKWQKEIDYRKSLQEAMKAFNKDMKKDFVKAYNALPEELKEEVEALQRIWGKDSPLVNLGGYHLSNNLANIKRLEQQIASIDKVREVAEGFTFTGGRVEFDEQEIRWNIFFDDIPEAEQRNKLKHNGFKWSPKRKAWTRGAKTMSRERLFSLLS